MLAAAAALLAVAAVAVAALLVAGKGGGRTQQSAGGAQGGTQPEGPAGGSGSAVPAASSGGGQQVIFSGRLGQEWRNDTDAARATVQIPGGMQHQGHAAIKVSTVAPYGGLRLASSGVSTVGFTHLRFFVRQTESATEPAGQVSGEIDGQYREGTSLSSTAVVWSNEPDGWTRVDVPLIWIGLDGGRLTSLAFDTGTDQTGITFWVADVALVSVPPTPAAADVGNVRFTAAFAGTPVPGVEVLVSTGAHAKTDAAGQALFETLPRGPLEYRIRFPDSFQGSPLVEGDEGRVTVKSGATVEQSIDVVKSDLRIVEPKNNVVAAPPITLRWQPYPGAAQYHVAVDPHGTGDAIEQDTAQTSLTLQSGLQPSTEYDFRVVALDAAGAVLARSDSASFRTP